MCPSCDGHLGFVHQGAKLQARALSSCGSNLEGATTRSGEVGGERVAAAITRVLCGNPHLYLFIKDDLLGRGWKTLECFNSLEHILSGGSGEAR